MNKDIVQGNWKVIKAKVKQQWNKLTDDEIGQLKGSYEELEGLIQKKYGYEKEKTKEEINNFLSRNNWEE